MSGSVFEDLAFKEMVIRLLIPLLMTLFFIQGFRTYVVDLYIAVWNIVWEGNFPLITLASLLVIGTPLFAFLFHKKIQVRKMIAGSAILTSICVLPISFGLIYELELLMSSLVVAFSSCFLIFYLYQQIQGASVVGSQGDVAIFTSSVAMALAYDIVIRALGGTYDISRTLVYFPVQFILSLVTIFLVVWRYRQGPSTQPDSAAVEEETVEPPSRIVGVLTIAGIGALLFLEFGLLANAHNILRWALPNYTLLDLALLTPINILAITVAVLSLTYSRIGSLLPKDNWYFIVIGNNIIFFSLTSLFLVGGGWITIALLIITQVFIIFNLYTLLRFALHPHLQWKSGVLCTSMFLILLIMVLWDFMIGFTFAHSYLGSIGAIFEGQALTVFLSATAILYITSSYAAIKVGRKKK